LRELSTGNTGAADRTGVIDMTDTIDRYIQRADDSGRPCVAGHRITVADIAIWHERLGQSADEISSEYGLTLAEVHAALAYYHDHRIEIEEDVRASATFVDGMKQRIASKIPGKLGVGA
jgi:uncharacterized protein (DUF433 family)